VARYAQSDSHERVSRLRERFAENSNSREPQLAVDAYDAARALQVHSEPMAHLDEDLRGRAKRRRRQR